MKSTTLKTIQMNRRQFLLFSAGVAAIVFAQTKLTGLIPAWGGRQAHLSARIAALFSHQESAQVIGLAYLQRYAQEGDSQVLLNQMLRNMAGGAERLLLAGDAELKALFQDRIRQDFADDNVVKLHGWILSTTEAQLCALATLAGTV
jgi:hypothetical protein